MFQIAAADIQLTSTYNLYALVLSLGSPMIGTQFVIPIIYELICTFRAYIILYMLEKDSFLIM